MVMRAFLSPLIKALPADDGEVVRRADILGQSPSTIGRELGIGTHAVSTRLRRGRRTLLQLVMLALQPLLEE